MRSAKFLVLLFVLILLFSANAFAQACFESNEKEVEFSHPTGSSLFFVPMGEDFSFKSTSHGVHTYEKGTTKLVIFTSSFITSTTSDIKAFARILEPKYNNADNYTKTTDFTEITVANFPAYYIEYSSKSTDDKGRMTVIIGSEFDTKTKVYIFDFTSKSARYDAEKEIYLSMLEDFSLSPLDECNAIVDDTDADDDGVDNAADNCPTDPNASQSNSDNDSFGDACDNCPLENNEDQADENNNLIGDVCEDATTHCTDVGGVCLSECVGISISAGDAQCGEAEFCCESVSDNNTDDNSNTDNNSNTTSEEPFEIFGFDGVLVIVGTIILLLIAGAGIVALIIAGVVIYFFFIKKK